ncbi:MAG: hypothetical protein WEB88_12630 [Gemmatimonadota bacterium]
MSTKALNRKAYERLLIETALACGYDLRLEERSYAGRTTTRIVHPVELHPGATDSEPEILTARLIGRSHELSIALDGIDAISLAIEHQPAGAVCCGDFTVGDAVAHPELGVGVIRSFETNGDGEAQASVLLELHGPRRVGDPATNLTPANVSP